MKTIARNILAIAALGSVILLSGCTTSQTARIMQTPPVYSFTVVESSTDREMTPQELDQLRDAVAKFLETQGVLSTGQYYVRVDFTPETPNSPTEWAIVRLSNHPAPTYTLIAAYPDRGDYYYSGNYGYGAYPYWGYYNPFDYNYGSYTRYVPVQPNLPPRQGKRGDKDHHGPPGTTATGEHKPGERYDHTRSQPADHPRNADRPDRGSRPQNTNYKPDSGDAGRVHQQGPADHSPSSSRDRSGGGSSSPPSPPSYSPPSQPSHSPSPQSSSSPPSRGTPYNKTFERTDSNQQP